MGQSLAQVYLHIIYHISPSSPKIPTELLNELHRYHAGICHNHDCPPIQIGGVEDHIHILCRMNRVLSISKALQEIKSASCVWLKNQSYRYEILKKFKWQNGYGVFSVSQSQVKTVDNYIRDQREHHKRMSFREEYIHLLRLHQVEYDDKYLWN